MYKIGDRVYTPSKDEVVVVGNVREPLAGFTYPVETSAGIFEEQALVRVGDEATREGVFLTRNYQDYQVHPLARTPRYLVPYDRLDAVGDLNTSLILDFNGHNLGGKILFEEYVRELMKFSSVEVSSVEELDAYFEAARTKVPLEKPVKVISFRDECDLCGMRFKEALSDGVRVWYEEPCAYSDGIPPNVWDLDVPSGVMVMSDSLEDLFPLPFLEGALPSVNTVYGRRKRSNAYAAVGLAHGYVGGSNPRVYRLGHGGYEISSYGWDAETDEQIIPPGVVEVAYVRGDGRWYSICDKDDFLRRCERFGQDPERFRVREVEVQPGRYRFEHDDMTAITNTGSPTYCRFTRTGPILSSADLLESWSSLSIKPIDYIKESMALSVRKGVRHKKTWEDSSEEEREDAWLYYIDRLFFSYGTGIEWHEDGFPASSSPAEPAAGDGLEGLPNLRRQLRWYPPAIEYSNLFGTRRLSPPFAVVLMRTLESIVSFGEHVHLDDTASTNPRKRYPEQTRELMRAALAALRRRVTEYPDLADPDYVWWLSQGTRAEEWVERFPLGPEHVTEVRVVPWDVKI